MHVCGHQGRIKELEAQLEEIKKLGHYEAKLRLYFQLAHSYKLPWRLISPSTLLAVLSLFKGTTIYF